MTCAGRLVAVVAMVQAASSGVVRQVVRREQVDWSHLAATWRVGMVMVVMTMMKTTTITNLKIVKIVILRMRAMAVTKRCCPC